MGSQFDVAVIGLGCRGMGLLKEELVLMSDVRIVALCDLYEDRIKTAADIVKTKCGNKPYTTKDWRILLQKSKPDAVVIATAWTEHIPISIACMESGIAVACEVGGAAELHECWELVAAYERTGTPIMMLENCCYGQDELLVLNMVRNDVLGRVIHCQGGYRHDLRNEVTCGWKNRHYRLDHYLHRNADNYPTHSLGPIAQILNLNRGNRMLSLCSVGSMSAGMQQYIRDKHPDFKLEQASFNQSDVITTTIKCADGETIVQTLDTSLPRYYSRGFTVQGTRGMYCEDNKSIFIDGVHDEFEFNWCEQWGNVEKYRKEFEHPIWRQYTASGVHNGHGGMDWLVLSAFFKCLREGKDMPIDVYDMASWMSITTLTEQSVAAGGTISFIPDFTKGKWTLRKPVQPEWPGD